MAQLLDLPGPSRRIRVEPLRLPEPVREPAGAPDRDPAESPARPEPVQPEPSPA